MNHFSGREKFTLIELLIVVAVIAILVGILLPALHKGREKAQMIACAGNMKMLTAGACMYSGDYDDWSLPVSGRIDGVRRSWNVFGWSYMVGRPMKQKYGGSGSIYDNPPIFYCAVSSLAARWRVRDYHFSNELSYGMNGNVQSIESGKLLKLTKLRSPASKFILTEKGGPSSAGTAAFVEYFVTGAAFHDPMLRHGGNMLDTVYPGVAFNAGNPGRANTGFFDGHVAAYGYAEFRANNAYCTRIP